MDLLGRCSLLFAALLARFARPGCGEQICRPLPCFRGACSGNDTVHVTFEEKSFEVKAWAGTAYRAQTRTVVAHSLTQADFGIFLHGPLFRPAQQGAQDYAPPLYISASLTDKIFRLEDFRKSGGKISANMKLVAWAAAPSTMFPIKPAREGGPERFLVAEGNPFIFNPGNHSMSTWLGGVDLLDEEKCTTIFPGGPLQYVGQVVNTVECHESGFCFFSVWKFYDDSLPLGPQNDCLYWCRVESVGDPTSCTDTAVMKDVLGAPICHVDGKGAVHGLKIGKTDPDDASSFDLFLLFTGKGTFDAGDSSIFKLKVSVSHLGDGKGDVKNTKIEPWGTELTQDTVQKPHDVGVDHAWVDDDGKYVWVGTFRERNNGVHMLDYDTGKLIHSITGVSTIVPNKYTYTSGVTGIGAWGKPGSVLAVATCEKFGEQFLGGTSAVVLIDISNSSASDSRTEIADPAALIV